MSSLKIEGGRRLSGTIELSGNKNAILPMIAASILTDQKVTIHNVPDIIDVANMLEIASMLGADVSRDQKSVTIKAAGIVTTTIPRSHSSRIRTSLLFAGPLLVRCGNAKFWPPGGDVIGRRRLDAHFYGLTTMGAEVISEYSPFELKAEALSGRELFFDEASVTATEHIMMTAVLSEGVTVIRNAAAEPHVQDLAEFLCSMGADISGIGTNTLTIIGKEKLNGTEYTVTSDHIEAGSFLAMSAITGGDLRINGTTPKHYWMMHRVFEKFNISFNLESDYIELPGDQELKIQPDLGNAVPVISDGPWPQYPTDMMSCTIVMATQAEGTMLFFEKMFESRIYFVDRLISMGANAIVCDPHRVVISGPAKLKGSEMSSPDIRAGMAMLIAALAADGSSIIHNADIIFRGYDSLIEKISSLGGGIEKI
jgi:UDP-N-acetylglucosamine 1-carboxyvinyltransferase